MISGQSLWPAESEGGLQACKLQLQTKHTECKVKRKNCIRPHTSISHRTRSFVGCGL